MRSWGNSKGENMGVWSKEEERKLDQALKLYGGTVDGTEETKWELISDHVKTRTVQQVYTKITSTLKRCGDDCAYQKVGPGSYGLKPGWICEEDEEEDFERSSSISASRHDKAKDEGCSADAGSKPHVDDKEDKHSTRTIRSRTRKVVTEDVEKLVTEDDEKLVTEDGEELVTKEVARKLKAKVEVDVKAMLSNVRAAVNAGLVTEEDYETAKKEVIAMKMMSVKRKIEIDEYAYALKVTFKQASHLLTDKDKRGIKRGYFELVGLL